MKNTYHLTTDQPRSALDAFCEKLTATHEPVDLISKAQYRKVRHDLSAVLDALTYPLPELEFNKETEWGDVIGDINEVFHNFRTGREKHEEITRKTLRDFKYKLLRSLDEMTER